MGWMFDCNNTFFTEVPECFEVMVMNAGLTDGNYIYHLRTPSGRIYRKEVTAVDGGIEIAATDFPDGLLNPWAGTFILQLFQGNNCEPATFMVCETEYNTLAIRVVRMEAAPEPVLLICECPVNA